jgi:hypothetical protein
MRAILVAAPLLLCLPACHPRVGASATPPAPTLWSVEVIDAGGAPTVSTLVCADPRLQAGFERAVPEVNGGRCEPVGKVVSAGPLFTGRCRASGVLFVFRSVSDQDRDGSFIVDTLIREAGPRRFLAAQSRLYWRTGDCPAGWEVGDTGAPGSREVRNAISGRTRTLASPAPVFDGG